MQAFRKLDVYAQALMVLLFSHAAAVGVYRSFSAGRNDWDMTEWLINYAGGFVRRGLIGEIIYGVSAKTNIPANYLAIAISVAVFLALIGWFAWRSAGRISALVLCSPILLGSAAYVGFIVRKDALEVFFLALCLATARSKANLLLKCVAMNVIGVFAILCHEEFFFIGFPAMVMVFYLSSRKSLLRSVAIFSPVILAFVLVSIYHGNAATSVAINASLANLWHQIDPGDCCVQTPSAEIAAIGWTLKEALPTSGLAQFTLGKLAVPIWICTIALCFIYLVALVEKRKGGGEGDPDALDEKSRLLVTLAFQLFVMSPMFAISWDYGRLIFMWTASSVAIYLIGVDWSAPLAARATARAKRLLERRRLPWKPRAWHLFFFGIPGFYWTVITFAQTSPVGSISPQHAERVVTYLSHLLH